MQEYRAVLERPEFGFQPCLVADLLALLARADWVLPDPLPIEIRDPDDLAFLEVAVAGGADVVVTGHVLDFTLADGELDVPILTPRAYIDLLAGRTAR
jgi:predicted nucleic acid-binding protein